MTDTSSQAFEDGVRHIARQLWPSTTSSGAAFFSLRERDGIFETDEQINLVEATVSRKLGKIQDDLKKTGRAVSDLRRQNPDKHVRGWIVTQDDPTADQREAAKSYKGKCQLLSYSEFQARLIDALTYLSLRQKYRFGSIEALSGSGVSPTLGDYIPLGLIETETGSTCMPIDVAQRMLSDHGRFLLLGEYGAGKSMTMRFLFSELVIQRQKEGFAQFPVLLNLRDHFGQSEPVEALERHARKIGFPEPSQLVRAWRAGLVTLLLDGFDEIASIAWTGNSRRLRDIRRDNMRLVRHFVEETPADSGVVICGRSQYFDSDVEMRSALGAVDGFTVLSLSEFSDEQVQKFLSTRGVKSQIPDWLPTRPLLIGYLAQNRLLDSLVGAGAPNSPSIGWDHLLTKIAQREAKIDTGIDGDSVRRIIERLATKARRDASGLGPLTPEDISAAFREVVGSSPDDRAQILLQRLPGLGAPAPEDGNRRFLDGDLADAARAGDVLGYVIDPFGQSVAHLEALYSTMEQLGVGVAEYNMAVRHISEGKMNAALYEASNRKGLGNLCLDLMNVMTACGFSSSGKSVFVQDGYAAYLSLNSEKAKFANVTIQDSAITLLSLPAEGDLGESAHFRNCIIEVLEGRQSRNDLGDAVFDDSCEVSIFADAAVTTDKILELPLSSGVRVLMTVLKKLFLQPGGGRRSSALHRGLDQRSRGLVPEVLNIILGEKVATPTPMAGHDVWLPDRGKTARVRAILAAPANSKDPLVTRCNAIT